MRGLEVLVPMKPLATAKSRLSPLVPAGRRQAAALAMLRRVLMAASEALGPEACQVVGGDEVVWGIARGFGCRWAPEPRYDLNSSLWGAMQDAIRSNAVATLFLPADLPMATPSDVEAVVASSDGLSRPAGVLARNDGGTNALLLPAALAFPPLLGEDSFARHAAELQARGTVLVKAGAPGLAFDVDFPQDLAWAEANVDGFASELDRWEQWLDEQATMKSQTRD